GTYHPGDLLGLAKQSGGNALYGQTLEAVTDPDAAVAVVVMPSGASATTCVARLLPNQLLAHDNIVADCTMTKDTEGTTAANTIRVTGTLKDRWGRTLGGVRTVPFQIAVTATTGDAITGTSPNGAVAIGTLGTARFSLAKRAGWI
uniref:hypothetical protein n=1 Tax=Acinetobacter oleivorans TaxID=1148157 RepID=UPI001C074361